MMGWTVHSAMSDPGRHAAALRRLPREPETLGAIVQGLLVHRDLLQFYGLAEGCGTRTTLPTAERLDRLLDMDRSPFEVARPPERRAVGTCRDFALLLTTCLRTHGVGARVRCGFAAYFGPGWADHWVCEYFDPAAAAWQLSDPQIDAPQRQIYAIAFDPARLPRETFLTAGQAWSAWRAGQVEARLFGHGDAVGPWFLAVNVVRDHLALNGHETSAWDGWREARDRVVDARHLALLDELAATPERELVEIAPFWRAA